MGQTTNYALEKPAVGSSGWGGGVNANFDTIDAQMKANADAVAGKVPLTRTVNSKALSSDVVLTTADVADSADKRYCTDAQKVVIGNTSGTNTGDQTLPTDATLTFTDVTTNDVSATKHGFFPKLPSVSDGKTYAIKNGAVAEVSSGGASVTTTQFDNDDLATGLYTITGEVSVVEVRDGSDRKVNPDVYRSGGNTILSFTNFGALVGTYEVDYI